MRRTKGISMVVLLVSSLVTVFGSVSASNTVFSSTMIFQGTLTYHSNNVYTGVIPMVNEALLGIGDNESGFDIYAKNGAEAWFGDDPGTGPVWTSISIGIDSPSHDAFLPNPAWDPDTPDWYQYSLNLYMDEGEYKWAVRNHPGATAANPWSSNPAAYPAHGVPMSGTMEWGAMYAKETDVGVYLSGTGTAEIPGGALAHGGGAFCWDMDWSWGSEVVPLQYPGFDVKIISIGQGQYCVILTPAPEPMGYPPEQQMNYSKLLCPLAVNNIGKAENLFETVQNLFDETSESDLDIARPKELIDKAAELLKKAKMFSKNSQNCIAANTLAIEAQKLLQKAKEILESMM